MARQGETVHAPKGCESDDALEATVRLKSLGYEYRKAVEAHPLGVNHQNY